MANNADDIKWWDFLFPPSLLLKLLRILLTPKKATSIAVLGMKSAGKTTLWKGLGGVKKVEETKMKTIPSFTMVRDDGSTVVINESIDIGGEPGYVKQYDQLIVPDCYIYYVADATKIQDYQYYRRIRSDLRKIDSVLQKKEITPNHIGFKILLSHYDELKKKEPGYSKEQLYAEFFDKMSSVKSTGYIGGLVRGQNKSIIRAVNLTKKPDISVIKDEIVKR